MKKRQNLKTIQYLICCRIIGGNERRVQVLLVKNEKVHACAINSTNIH